MLHDRAELEAIASEIAVLERVSRKDDGRDYQAEIEAAGLEKDRLWDLAQDVVDSAFESEESRREALEELVDIDRQLSSLMLSFPVSDFDAQPIPEGRQLFDEITALRVWLEEQHAAISAGSTLTLHSLLTVLARAA
jgi:hypothetical protein